MNGQILQGPIQIKGGVLNMVTELKPFSSSFQLYNYTNSF